MRTNWQPTVDWPTWAKSAGLRVNNRNLAQLASRLGNRRPPAPPSNPTPPVPAVTNPDAPPGKQRAHQALRSRIIAALMHKPGQTVAELGEALGTTKENMQNAIVRMSRAKLIHVSYWSRKPGYTKGHVPAHWALGDQPDAPKPQGRTKIVIQDATITSIKQWFEVFAPNPTDKNRAVQIGVHLEETGEMGTAILDRSLATALAEFATTYKKRLSIPIDGVARVKLVDALADQVVTAFGVAHMFNFDLLGALGEVDRSNWTKYVNGKPFFDADGKVAKPPSYEEPNLLPFV